MRHIRVLICQVDDGGNHCVSGIGPGLLLLADGARWIGAFF